MGSYPQSAIHRYRRHSCLSLFQSAERRQVSRQIMALYDIVFPVLYSGCDICTVGPYAWNADASQDGMLYTYADFFYQEGAKRWLILK